MSARGFTLIELVVVIALFSLTAFGVAAGYLTFEKNQKLKNAASALKNDIRFAQNKALSGDKGAGGPCASSSTLGGWYMELVDEATSYKIAGDCLTGTTEAEFSARTVNLPNQVRISQIDFGTSLNQGEANLLFRPLSPNVSVHTSSATPTSLPPDFFDTVTPIGLRNLMVGSPQDLTITLTITNGGTYRVILKQSGEVHETP